MKETWLWKENLNGDGKQFHRCQQHEQSPLSFTHWTQGKTTTYDVRYPDPGLGRTHTCGGLNQLMGSHPCPLDNWISNVNIFFFLMYLDKGSHNMNFFLPPNHLKTLNISTSICLVSDQPYWGRGDWIFLMRRMHYVKLNNGYMGKTDYICFSI